MDIYYELIDEVHKTKSHLQHIEDLIFKLKEKKDDQLL